MNFMALINSYNLHVQLPSINGIYTVNHYIYSDLAVYFQHHCRYKWSLEILKLSVETGQ